MAKEAGAVKVIVCVATALPIPPAPLTYTLIVVLGEASPI
uniref:Uncharacterized protein n=1 Tax=Siphoviridae sp. ctNEy24 TaxID=2825466 RepID=A0A8S5U0I8_9CAUD|nr:MAG TPA: hypothetical protein [Siphoviridae sp. ctNEy24]